MKKLIFLLSILFASCAEYKAMMAEDTINIKNEKVYFSDANREILTVMINDVPHDFIFDTGAGATLLYHPKFQVDDKKKIRERFVYGFDKKTKIPAYNYSARVMETEMFKVNNKYLYITDPLKNSCDSIRKFDGILGSFYESDLLLELNYEKGYLQFLDDFDSLGWLKFSAKVNEMTGKIYVKMEVNGMSDFFLFDTGNSTMVYLNPEVFLNPGNKFYAIDMLGNSVGNSSVQLKMDVYEARLTMNDLTFTYPVSILQSSKRSVLSKRFISNFNWVFDRKNEVVYCKPINPEKLGSKVNMSAKKDRLQVTNIGEKLIVSFRNFDSPFRIGDQIVSVGGNPVTSENICEIRKLLNSTENWATLGVKSCATE